MSKKEPFLLVVNKCGSGYLFTDRDTFNGTGTFEQWRKEAIKITSKTDAV